MMCSVRSSVRNHRRRGCYHKLCRLKHSEFIPIVLFHSRRWHQVWVIRENNDGTWPNSALISWVESDGYGTSATMNSFGDWSYAFVGAPVLIQCWTNYSLPFTLQGGNKVYIYLRGTDKAWPSRATTKLSTSGSPDKVVHIHNTCRHTLA